MVDLDTPYHDDHVRDDILNAGCRRCAPFIENPRRWQEHRNNLLAARPSDEVTGLREVAAAARLLVEGYSDQSEEGDRKVGRAYLNLVAALANTKEPDGG